MLVTAIIVAVLAVFLVTVLVEKALNRISFAQALLFTPLRLIWRVDTTGLAAVQRSKAPVVYAVSHQSGLDPALMLCLLPADTLHILDPDSAASHWLEPFRGLARTIEFNARHVFVSRRLVRHLKGKGRLAVYVPGDIEPDATTLRLYRAIARIAARADAAVVSISVGGSRNSAYSLVDPGLAPRRRFGKLRPVAIEAATIEDLLKASPPGVDRMRGVFFDRMAEARVATQDPHRTLFSAMVDAAELYGPGTTIVEDPLTGSLTYKRLLIGARVLARRFAALSRPGEPVGLMLPNANGVAVAFFALQSAGRVVAMINYSAGPANIASAVRTAQLKTVVSSRAFIEKANLDDAVKAVEAAGADIVWLEDIRDSISPIEKVMAALSWKRPVAASKAKDPAVILFTSGSEGTPKGAVLSHSNVLTNVAQVQARIEFSPKDTLFNVLPVFHSFGLTCGTILPLTCGVRLFLYPSPLHYRLIPQAVSKVRPTILLGTDTFLNGYARTARDSDFASLRLVVAGAEPVKPETERNWLERFGAQVFEGYGMTEASPITAVNSHTHRRSGTVGRLLPGIRARLEPVEGIAEGGRLWIWGPNVMLGYMTADRPGELQPSMDGWHDSGDIVSFDREGYVTIRGRAKRFAKVAGEMVSLGAVEMLVQSLWPEERHAAVSLPDHRKGERIVLVTTATQADAEKLRAFGRQAGAADLMVPNDIVKVADIPVLGSGKTDYLEARKLALDKLGVKDEA